jgi:hypothetical protein
LREQHVKALREFLDGSVVLESKKRLAVNEDEGVHDRTLFLTKEFLGHTDLAKQYSAPLDMG